MIMLGTTIIVVDAQQNNYSYTKADDIATDAVAPKIYGGTRLMQPKHYCVMHECIQEICFANDRM